MSSMQQAFVVTGTGGDSRRVPVGASIVVGRGGTCDLVIRDLAASRQHLKILKVANGYVCRDLESSNGTQVNEELIDVHPLEDGDEIRIGNTSLFFSLSPGVEPAPMEKTVFLQTIIEPSGSVTAPPSTPRQGRSCAAAEVRATSHSVTARTPVTGSPARRTQTAHRTSATST